MKASIFTRDRRDTQKAEAGRRHAYRIGYAVGQVAARVIGAVVIVFVGYLILAAAIRASAHEVLLQANSGMECLVPDTMLSYCAQAAKDHAAMHEAPSPALIDACKKYFTT